MKLNDTVYLILEPKRTGRPNPETGRVPATGVRIAGLRRERPAVKAGQWFVKTNIAIDSAIFEQPIPVANIDIDGSHVVVNADVEGQSIPTEEEA